MDAETRARATEPFYTTKGVGKGTGLGLSMVHGLAEQSGGRLLIRSKPGEGTAMEMWLPLAERGVEPVSSAARSDRGEADDGPPLTILAVDDDSLVLMNTLAMLEDMGHRVLSASSGREALAIAEREPVDLVITDYAMPTMNGVQLLEALRKRTPDLPALLATGYAELPTGVGGDLPRLAKPFLQNDLRRALRTLADRRRRDTAA
jgi:CheY-like chemotaxis protein